MLSEGPPSRGSRDGAETAPFSRSATRNDRLMILVLLCGSLAMVAVVWWYYSNQKRAMETAAATELLLVSEAQAKQVSNWRIERIGDGRVVASEMVMRVARRMLARPRTPDDSLVLSDVLSRMAREYNYSDATLVDMDGAVQMRLSEPSTEEAQWRQRIRQRMAHEAVAVQDVVLSDIGADTRTGKPMMSLTVPVDRIGALIFDIDPARFLYPYLEAQRGARKTLESMLMRRDGNELVLLSRRRFPTNGELFPRRPLDPNNVPSDKELAAGWLGQWIDYRGVPGFGVVRSVPDSRWYLIMKMDQAELDEPVRQLAWQVIFMTLLIGLGSLVCVVLIIRDQRERVRREKDAYLYAVVNDTPALLWMTGADGQNAFLNRELARFLGLNEQRLDKNWVTWVHGEDAAAALQTFKECLKERREYRDEFRLRRSNGEFRWVISEGSPRYSADGEYAGYTGSLYDITERRTAEMQLRWANQKLEQELKNRISKEAQIRTLSARLIVAEEEGRKRVARELHDDLSQQIAALSIGVGSLKRKLPLDQEEARERSDRIHQKLVQLAESVRRLSHELHPAVLQYSGLEAALREHVSSFATATKIAARLETDGRFEDVPPEVSLCLYRITQEALRNIEKHAKATAAVVRLRAAAGELQLDIEDNGVGVEADASEAGAGLGLVSMEERARLAGGTFRLRSGKNEGTTLSVRIPPRS